MQKHVRRRVEEGGWMTARLGWVAVWAEVGRSRGR